MSAETIDIEATATPTNQPQQMAIVRSAGGALGKALTVEELHERLEFVRRVMKKEMKIDVDYGKIPGAGDKPSLLQPGAQKLLLTFNLREQVKKEVLREYSGFHREYEFVVTVFPAGQNPEDGWDGVGTCSTLEKKYRYRKAQRECPTCHKQAIIEGKADFGGGFVCWKKRGGCGATFPSSDGRITSQPAGDVENEDPADQWNTVRKMAFKRALVAAAINATNTSELWTQDVEDMDLNGTGPRRPQGKPATPAATSTRPAAQSPSKPGKPAQAPPRNESGQEKRYATAASRVWLIKRLEPQRDLATEYFRKLASPAVLMPNENLEDLPLWILPINLLQTKALEDAITGFGNGEEIRHPYPANELKPVEKPKEQPKPAPTPSAPPAKRPPPAQPDRRDPEWFFDVICPVPHKGQKRDDYLKRPDTIRSLYTQLKEGDEEAGKRLWGFAHHYEPKGWNNRPPSNADLVFREALDAFCDWHEDHGQDSTPDDAPDPELEEPAATRGAFPNESSEEQDVPF